MAHPELLSQLGIVGRGLVSSLSIIVGYLPIAFSFGLAAVQGGIPPSIVLLSSVIVFAGASQFALIGLLSVAGASWATVPTVLLMNARHLLYGAPVIDRMRSSQPMPASPLLSFGLTDEVFATAMTRFDQIEPGSRGLWFVGLQLGAYSAWVAGTFAGISAGHNLLDSWPGIAATLDFMLVALFVALLVEMNLKRHWLATLVAALVTALLLSPVAGPLPAHFAIALGVLAGIATTSVMAPRRNEPAAAAAPD